MADDVTEIIVTAARIPNAVDYSNLSSWVRYYVTTPPSLRLNEWQVYPQDMNALDKTSDTYIKSLLSLILFPIFNMW